MSGGRRPPARRRSAARAPLLGLLALLAASLAAGPADALDRAGRDALARAMRAGDEGAWSFAEKLVSRVDDSLATAFVAWRELRERKDVPFRRYRDFLARHPDWPDSDGRLRAAAEGSIRADDDPAAVRRFFDDSPPTTAAGREAHALALLEAGETTDAARAARGAWRTGRFSAGGEAAFLARLGDLLRDDDHAARLDALLWAGRIAEARRMKPRVSAGLWRLAEARVLLQTSTPGVDGAVDRVPEALKGSAGLAYDRLMWRQRKERYDDVVELLRAAPDPEDHGASFWKLRAFHVRRLIGERAHASAYRLAKGHGQSEGAGFADGEWLAGWLALRFLDQPDTALRHFARMWGGVGRPISRSRAAYWAGRAAEAAGDRTTAGSWYGRAALHATAYYGQLALETLNEEPPAPRPAPAPGAAARAAFERKEATRVVRMATEAGLQDRADQHVLALGDAAATAEELALVAALADEAGRPDLTLAVGKRALWRGLVAEDIAFPLPPVDGFDPESRDHGVPAELVLAVGRQESEFDPDAESPAGAVGLLQLLPSTARSVAREAGVAYSPSRLRADPAYNLDLGRRYLARQIADFGSVPLAVAAYNAGPYRVRAWLTEIGDPREGAVDPIDWIELLPFAETRNYVQRVLESREVYRRRFAPSGDAARIDPPPAKPREAT